jgi:hypothetical protein
MSGESRRCFTRHRANMAPVVNLVKLFKHRFTQTFCKLDHYINRSNICCIAMKGLVSNRLSKFALKGFEIGPWMHFYVVKKLEK